MDEIRLKAAQSSVPENVVRAWLRSFRAGDKNDPVFRQRLVDAFVADIAVDPDGVTISYNAKEARTQGSSTGSLSGVCETVFEPVVVGPYILLRVPGVSGSVRR